MASEGKLTKQQLKDPDAFQKVTSAYWEKLVEHRTTVLLAVGGTLALLLVIAIAQNVMARKGDEAGAALSRAMETVRRPVEGANDPATDPDLPKFKTSKEKNEEIAKAFEDVRAKYPGSDAAKFAALTLGDAQYQLGKYDDAAKSYEAFLDSSKDEPMRALAFEGLGYIAESKKDWAKAAENFEKMGQSGKAAGQLGTFHKARLLEEQGKKEEAANLYAEVKNAKGDDKDAKETAVMRAASERLSTLAAQGVKVPEAKKDEKAEAKK